MYRVTIRSLSYGKLYVLITFLNLVIRLQLRGEAWCGSCPLFFQTSLFVFTQTKQQNTCMFMFRSLKNVRHFFVSNIKLIIVTIQFTLFILHCLFTTFRSNYIYLTHESLLDSFRANLQSYSSHQCRK